MTIPALMTLAALCCSISATAAAAPQGGGASATGSIIARVSDPDGLPIAGATVIAVGGLPPRDVREVTQASGVARLPGLALGEYVVTIEFPGMTPIRHERVQVSIGFTATIDAAMQLAATAETVVVSSEASPLMDRVSTRVDHSFRLDQLQSLPTARDEWSLLSLTPGVMMQQADVGGSRAGRVTPSTAYGFGAQDSQTRVLVEGINITEGTSRSGVYLDFGAHEEAFIGTAAHGAEMPTVGVLTQFVGRSGGDRFGGEVYGDFESHATQASNLPSAWLAPAAFNGSPLRPNSNRVKFHHDLNANAGGALRRRSLWAFASARHFERAFEQSAFAFDDTQQIRIWNISGKGTYQMTPAHRLITYYQWQQKVDPRVPWSTAFSFTTPADTARQDTGSWVWKGEWNHTLAGKAFTELRYGEYGYYFPLLGSSDAPFRSDAPRRLSEGGDARVQQDRGRWQLTAATSWTHNRVGLHWLRAGAEIDRDTFWRGVERIRAGNIQHQFNNGVSQQVTFGFPTVDGAIGGKSARHHLLSVAALDRASAFVTDEWTVAQRWTVSAGLRFDRYRAWAPEQRQLASERGPIAIPALSFQETTFLTWSGIVPRLGVAWDAAGEGRIVVKAFYGLFGHNPGPDLPARANPNQSTKTVTFQWSDRNGNRLYDVGEEGSMLASALSTAIGIDPGLRQPHTHEWTVFVENAATSTIALRAGMVRRTSRDLWQVYRPGRPPSAYSSPFQFADFGADGQAGTTDDVLRQFLGVPLAESERFPLTQVVQNVPALARYTSVELGVERRAVGRWSFAASAVLTRTHEHAHWTLSGNRVTGELDSFPAYFPNSPNDTSLHRYSTWSAKATGSYDAPWRIGLIPVIRHQSGQPYGRTLSVSASAASGAVYQGTVLVEPLGARRMDNITLIDVRGTRGFAIGAARVEMIVDVFNVLNAHPVHGLDFRTGLNFERPLAVVSPRTARLAARFVW